MIDKHHDVLWVQVMKSIVVTEYNSLEVVFSSNFEDCDGCEGEDLELTRTLEQQLCRVLPPELTRKNTRGDGQAFLESTQKNTAPGPY